MQKTGQNVNNDEAAGNNAHACNGMPLHIVTPLIESLELSAVCGTKVLLKLENTQPSGSFKIRGIGHLLQQAVASGNARGVVSSSGGNAGMAAAYAARQLQLPVTVVLPSTTHSMVAEKLQREGATVVVHGDIWNKANEKALELAKHDGIVYVHPFHHPHIWTGVSSLVDEVLQQCKSSVLSCVVLSVGGGGLLSGVLQGLMRHGLEKVPVVAMETVGADCFNAALAAGRPVSIGNITSIAKTLGALTVTDQVFSLLPHCNVISKVVTDKQAVDACLQFADDHRHLVEPSCGAALAAIYSGIIANLIKQNKISKSGAVVCVVCGGNAVTIEMLTQWRDQMIS